MSEFSVSKHLKKNYDGYYSEASEWRRLGAIGKVDNLVKLCSSIPHESILEIGAGDGAILNRMSETQFGSSLHALDISESAVQRIRERSIPNLAACETYDGYTVDYPDQHFDLVVLCHVVEHLEHPRQLLREASRVGKTVFVEVPMEDTWRLSPDYMWDPVGHINFYNPRTIRRLLQTCELDIDRQLITTNMSKEMFELRQGAVGSIKYFAKAGLLAIAPRLAARALTYHISLLCHRQQTVDVESSPVDATGSIRG